MNMSDRSGPKANELVGKLVQTVSEQTVAATIGRFLLAIR